MKKLLGAFAVLMGLALHAEGGNYVFTGVGAPTPGVWGVLPDIDPSHLMRVTVSTDVEEVIITFPNDNQGPYLSDVVINGSQFNFYSQCFGPLAGRKRPPVCSVTLKVASALIEGGRLEVRVPKGWLYKEFEELWLIHRRYYTCVESSGATDINHKGRRCPPVSELTEPIEETFFTIGWDSFRSTTFVFREEELDRIYEWLDEESVRLEDKKPDEKQQKKPDEKNIARNNESPSAMDVTEGPTAVNETLGRPRRIAHCAMGYRGARSQPNPGSKAARGGSPLSPLVSI